MYVHRYPLSCWLASYGIYTYFLILIKACVHNDIHFLANVHECVAEVCDF